MFWIAFISLIIFTLGWILLVPLVLRIDTQGQLYQLNLPGILSARIVPSEEIFYIRIWAFFLPFRLRPFRARKSKGNKERVPKVRKSKVRKSKVKSRKKKGLRSMLAGAKNGRTMLRCIRIRRLYLDIDTDDFITNAWLVPAFSVLNDGPVRMQVNFEGRASLDMDLRVRLGNLLWTMIITSYKNKFHS